MRTTFTVAADQIQTLAINAANAQIRVVASEETTTATLEVSGPANAVQAAEATLHKGIWSLFLPEQPAGGGMVISGGTVMINGTVFTSTGNGPTVIQGAAEPVKITARVPTNIRVSSQTGSGSLHTLGHLNEVASWATSGNVYVNTAEAVQASATSGNITVSRAESTLRATSTSGNIEVRGGSDIRLNSTSGDIGFASTQNCRLSARSTSGDITLVRQHNVAADVSSTSGDISS